MARYFAALTMIPACPWFPPPRAEGMLAAIEMGSFFSVVMTWSFGCPWILVNNSFLSSSHVSACNPILMVKLASALIVSDN